MVGANQYGRKKKFTCELGAERKYFQVGDPGVSPLLESGYRPSGLYLTKCLPLSKKLGGIAKAKIKLPSF